MWTESDQLLTGLCWRRYDDYLDSRITDGDLQCLGTRDLSRKLVEHG